MTGFNKTTDNDEIVISLRDISKKYLSPLSNGNSFYALKKLNLQIRRGDKVGITGDNGAGKTTLLKIISGITKPSNGQIITKGKIVALTNLEAGFDEELSGRENIILNCMLYGISRERAKSIEKEIIKFADIGKFIDAPFYTYSSGMKFRLAFSIAISSNPDIFLIDEIFMSGDIGFQIKTLEKIGSLSKNNNITFVICSHYPLILRKYCTSFYYLKKGVINKASLKDIESITKKWNEFFKDVPLTKEEIILSNDPHYTR